MLSTTARRAFRRLLLLLPFLCGLLAPCRLPAQQLRRHDVPAVIAQLRAPNAAVRAAAATRLGTSVDPRVISPLLDTACYDEPTVAQEAVVALHTILQRVVDLTNSMDPATRAGMFTLLAKDCQPDVAELQPWLAATDERLRAGAARALGWGQNQAAIPPLCTLAQHDPRTLVRVAAAAGLGDIHDKRVLPPLRQLLGDDSPRVRAAAARALGQLAQLPLWLRKPQPDQHTFAINPHPTPAAPAPDHALQAAWQIWQKHPQQVSAADRRTIQQAQQRLGWAQTKEAMAALLADHAPEVRVAASLTLFDLADPRAADYLAEGLDAAEADMRADTVRALCGCTDPSIVNHILRLGHGTQDEGVLLALVKFAQASGDKRFTDLLLALLPAAARVELRKEIIETLGSRHDPRIPAALRPFVHAPYVEERMALVKALGHCGNPQAGDVLVQLVKDPDHEVRFNALTVLAASGAWKDPHLVATFTTLLADPDDVQRRQLFTLLVEGGTGEDPHMLEVLVNALKHEDEDWATSYLNTQVGDNKTAIPLLLAVKDEVTLHKDALLALSVFADPRVTAVMLAALPDRDEDIFTVAFSNLLHSKDPQVWAKMLDKINSSSIERRKHALAILKVKSVLARPLTPWVITQLQDPDSTVRAMAIALLALERASDEWSKNQLWQQQQLDAYICTALAAVAENDGEAELRLAAVQALVYPAGRYPAIETALITSGHPEVSVAAITGFASSPGPAYLEALLTASNSPQSQVRVAAMTQFGGHNEPRACAAKLAALQDVDPAVRAAAAKGLGRVPLMRALSPLLALLQDDSLPVRLAAIEALGHYQTPAAWQALLAKVNDPDPAVRAGVLSALGVHGDAEDRAPLLTLGVNGDAPGLATVLAALHDPEENIRAAATRVACKFADPQAIAACYTLLEAQVTAEDIEKIAGGPRFGETPVLQLAESLCERAALAVPTAIAWLGKEHPLLRETGAALLVQMTDAHALPALTLALQDPEARVRQLAARALRALGDVRALAPLTAALHDDDAAARAEAALALGQLQDTRALEPLLALLQDNDADVQFAAVWALGQLADARATTPLLALAGKNIDPGLRRELLATLSRLGDARTTELLLATLQSKDRYQRDLAILGLGKLREPRALAPLIDLLNLPVNETDRVDRCPADPGHWPEIRSLGYAYSQALPNYFFSDALAVRALGEIGGAAAIAPLAEFMRRDGVGPEIAWALGQFVDERAARALIEALHLPSALTVQNGQMSALYALSDGPVSAVALEPLMQALPNATPAVQELIFAIIMRMTETHEQISWMYDQPVLIPARTDPRLPALLLAYLPTTEKASHQLLLIALGNLGDPRATRPLLVALRDEQTRASATLALAKLHDPLSVAPLLALLNDGDAAVRAAAVDVLGLMPAPAAADALAALLQDADAQVRVKAALALARLSDPRALAPLLALLQRETAHLGENDPAMWHIQVSVPWVADNPAMWNLWGFLPWALGELGDPRAIEPVLSLPDMPMGNYRKDGVWSMLWRLDHPAATEALLQHIRRQMADSGSSRILNTVLQNLQYHEQNSYHAGDNLTAAAAERKLADERVQDLLIDVVQHGLPVSLSRREQVDDSLPLRQKALWALGRCGNPRVVPTLLAALETGPLPERREATLSLGKLRDPRAIDPLITALRDFGADARPAVSEALKEITGQDFGPDPERWQAWRGTLK